MRRTKVKLLIEMENDPRWQVVYKYGDILTVLIDDRIAVISGEPYQIAYDERESGVCFFNPTLNGVKEYEEIVPNSD